MKEYHFFMIGTQNYQKLLKMVLKSLRHWKSKQSNYIVHLYMDSQKITYFQQSFDMLKTDTFKVEVKSAIPYKNLLEVKNSTFRNYLLILRLLIPKLFPQLDKILILDCDLFINQPGIEDFYDENIDKYYVNAVSDITVTVGNFNTFPKEREQCKTKNYFNTGVFVLNLKKMRKDGIDIKLAQAGIITPKNIYPYFGDQTIWNYIIKNKAHISSPIYNNMILTMFKNFVPHQLEYNKQWNINSIEEYIDNTIIVHFAGPKPWTNEINQNDHTFAKAAKKFYEKFKKYFGQDEWENELHQ